MRRDFESPVPTYKLVGDTAYLRTTSGFIYLATAVDLCTRMVVGRGIADNTGASLVVSAMETAWGRGYVAGNAIFHSDRGSQHAGSLFAAWAKAHDVRLSVGRTGSCHGNAVALGPVRANAQLSRSVTSTRGHRPIARREAGHYVVSSIWRSRTWPGRRVRGPSL